MGGKHPSQTDKTWSISKYDVTIYLPELINGGGDNPTFSLPRYTVCEHTASHGEGAPESFEFCERDEFFLDLERAHGWVGGFPRTDPGSKYFRLCESDLSALTAQPSRCSLRASADNT